jgi:hypothetical protein
MKQRCSNPNDEHYPNYGGRGIRVCNRWLNSFEAFLEDMGKRPGPEYSIERMDVNGNYGPDNCKWATVEEQCSNKRNNVHYEFNGQKLTLPQISRLVGIPLGTLDSRIKREGLTLEEAIGRKFVWRHITYKGETKTLGEWAKIYNMNYGTLRNRMDAGLPFELALLRSNRKTYTHDGVEKSIRRLAKEFSLSKTGLSDRLRRGWTLEEALSEKKWVKK